MSEADGQVAGRPMTSFAAILRRVVDSTPGAVAAVFVDEEGEAVDVAGEGETIDVMLAGAHLGVLLARFDAAHEKAGAGRVQELRLVATRAQYVTRPLGHGYHVTVMLEPVATIPKLVEALDEAAVQLRLEAGGVID